MPNAGLGVEQSGEGGGAVAVFSKPVGLHVLLGYVLRKHIFHT